MRSKPSLATVKRLFAVSGNRCGFPRCRQPLVHEGKITGRICHVRAASPEGPRFDGSQGDEERNGFDNLLLLCPIHHDVIDADVRAYTVDRLLTMKFEHERSSTQSLGLSDAEAQQLISNLSDISVDGGSLIITNYQSGGQAAHIINNYGTPKRFLPPDVSAKMLKALQPNAGKRIGFASTQGDTEAHDFKVQLIRIFTQAGWVVQDQQTFMFFGSCRGLVITIPFNDTENGILPVVASALALTRQPVSWNRGDMANECGVYVQVWHAPEPGACYESQFKIKK